MVRIARTQFKHERPGPQPILPYPARLSVMWGLLLFFVGLLYGWMGPGEQDKGRLLWSGFLMGIVIALALCLLGAALGSDPLPFGDGIAGVVLTVLILTVVFVAGAWLGDLVESALGRKRTRTA